MKVFSAQEIQKIDAYTIAHEPIVSIDLMERAAKSLTNWYVRRFRIYRRVVIFAGPGNNGGDALAMARMLDMRQYKVECYLLSNSGNFSEDCGINLRRLKEKGRVSIQRIKGKRDFPSLSANDVIIDGIFGSGLSRPVEGIYKEVIRHINDSEGTKISIDIPSGLFGEDNSNNTDDAILKADYTLTFQFPFLSFLFAENHIYSGEWMVLDIGLHQEIIDSMETSYSLIDKSGVKRVLPGRGRFDHKGTLGHALAIAGSHGMMGAAILSGEAALRSGAGLVTIHVPEKEGSIVQTALPEAIVSLDSNNHEFSRPPAMDSFSAVAIGPGLGMGKTSMAGLKILLEKYKGPLVIDADALNLISKNRKLISQLPRESILTPHPREFERLAGKSKNGYARLQKLRTFASENKIIVLLKGAYTSIALPDGTVTFNPTGNPGMATGGSGDVLTGIIVSLLAQGMQPGEAAVSGAYIHGLAGDIAADELGQEAMTARDITKYIGSAFREIKQHRFLPENRA